MKSSQESMIKEQIETLARRIEEFEKSPDPTVFRSNKLLYELGKERLEAQLEVWRRGRPSVLVESQLSRFFRSMGLEPYNLTGPVDYATASYGKYKAIIERMGFPEKCCERAVVQMAVCDIGDLPKPDIIFGDGHGCDADHKHTSRSLSDWFTIPMFYIDTPLDEDDKPNLANLNYVVDQLGEFIQWAEKNVPGVKYNEERHIEWLEMDAIGEKYVREIYQLTKHVPCPITPLDVMRKAIIKFRPSYYPNMQKAIEYLQILRDEVGDRVASGKGPYPEERLRLLWAGQSHDLQVVNPAKLLLERKVALPLSFQGNALRFIGLRCAPIGEMSEYGVKLSPLQEEARTMTVSCWGGPGKRWVNGTLDAARDIGAHGIIHWLQIGCTPMFSMGSVVAARAEKELGIPTLNLEGRQMDKEFMSQEQFDETLSVFIDKCFDWAGKPRQ